MRTVHKFPLPEPGTDNHIQLGEPYKSVHVGPDPSGRMCIWFEHDMSASFAAVVRVFIVGTGHEVPDGAKHASSFVHSAFVWHAYHKRVA